jgi:hypothetical protein
LAVAVSQVGVEELADSLAHVPGECRIGERLVDIERPAQVGAALRGLEVKAEASIGAA